MFGSQNINRNWPPPEVAGCFATKDLKFWGYMGRVVIGKERLALQGAPLESYSTAGLKEEDLVILTGNMFNLFSMSTAALLLFSATSWNFTA